MEFCANNNHISHVFVFSVQIVYSVYTKHLLSHAVLYLKIFHFIFFFLFHAWYLWNLIWQEHINQLWVLSLKTWQKQESTKSRDWHRKRKHCTDIKNTKIVQSQTESVIMYLHVVFEHWCTSPDVDDVVYNEFTVTS